MIDIQQGDILIVNGREYPVNNCAVWICNMPGASFSYLATEKAMTKRAPEIQSMKRGEPIINLVGLHCMPLDPVSSETIRRFGLESPVNLLETYLADGDQYVHLVVERDKA